MKIINAEQTRQLDQYTIENEPIASIDLMERASLRFSEWFSNKFSSQKTIKIFAGMGNNGGDGLAVARMLYQNRYKVEVYIIKYSDTGSIDFHKNEKRLSKLPIKIIRLDENSKHPELGEQDIIIDAIFGSGLNRPIRGFTACLIQHLNDSAALKVSIDIPSGLFCDNFNADENIFRADHTLSFQFPKLSFMLPQNHVYVGEWAIKDIGLHKEKIEHLPTSFFFIDQDYISSILKTRKKFDHKGTYGHALLVGGSYGKIGAVVLATKAALRSGAGLISARVPSFGYTILQSNVPEAMCITEQNEDENTHPPFDSFSSIGIGPGMGTDANAQSLFISILQQINFPIVVDADAINLIGKYPALMDLVPKGSILTPHPKEFERLTSGKYHNQYERLEVQREFAKEYEVTVLVKGAHSSIALPSGEVYFNSTGNSGMATGGSGDVLTGIITGLLAQSYRPEYATILGVYLHGLAGDFAAKEKSETAMIASDIINNLGEAYKTILS
ncbi:NAD(P)H-hydrate dehydratase [Sediminitomix flava]|uniref:Bifunctional NAD(P)H-hydrate repair enzyme n=1 Tax=Sediminitomix flava TaxID=379075 RepID=A0A315ZUE5_SEDFL|nr:NAD(P)H-hydrate dehydratase [Sediminitomix flava]PWJ39259.1 NAD(P)H-hydrate epimerase [Sediminitomix flava]